MQKDHKSKLILFAVAAFSAFVLSGCQAKSSEKAAESAPQDSIVIEFKDGNYNPSNITIKQNQKVTFVNKSEQAIWPASNIHPTHQIYPAFDPRGPVKPGSSWTFSFTKQGIWKFHDHLEPTITGTITVE